LRTPAKIDFDEKGVLKYGRRKKRRGKQGKGLPRSRSDRNGKKKEMVPLAYRECVRGSISMV